MIAVLHTRQDGDHLHHGLSALAHRQRRAGLLWVLINIAISAVVLLAVNCWKRTAAARSGRRFF
jgi:hypothetical protein